MEEIKKKTPKKCTECKKALVSIGSKRKNGKMHVDWPSRMMHKKCWKELHN